MNRRGFETVHAMSYFWKVFFTIAIGLVLIILLRSSVSTDFDVSAVEANIFYYRLIYGPYGLSVMDEDLGQVRPGVIDLTSVLATGSFEKNLTEGMSFAQQDQRRLGARIELFDNEGKKITEAYYNRAAYDALLPLSYKGSGPGAAQRFEHGIYVLMKDAGTLAKHRGGQVSDPFHASMLVPGKLKITVVKQNS